MGERKYFKRNYVDVLKIITPKVYLRDDISLAGLAPDINTQLVNSHIISSKYITYTTPDKELSGLQLSATANLPNLDNPVGVAKYFVKQNGLTNISPRFFETAILEPLNVSFSNYQSKEEFSTYVSATLLPSIRLNSFDLASNTASAFDHTLSGTHEYLTSTLSWLYFLNTSGLVSNTEVDNEVVEVVGFAPSSLVFSALTDMLYEGKTITLDYAIKMYQEYLWRNYNSLSSVDGNIIPANFYSGTGSYSSGTQNLEKLKTLIDIEYSPLYSDKDNTLVKDAFENYLNLNTFSDEVAENGPLHKLLKAVGYTMFDINNEVESIKLLTSIESCPKEYLPFLADLIGWRLYGSIEDSWRRQLRNAMSLYKKKGTKEGLIDALNSVIPNNPLDPEESITEFYESYVPNLLFYLLRTDSPLFESLNTWTLEQAQSLGVMDYDPEDLDLNVKYAVDELLQRTVAAFPALFRIGKEPFRVNITESGKGWFGETHLMPDGRMMTGASHTIGSEHLTLSADPNFVFTYRGREHSIPPWEDERYYKNTAITEELLTFLKNELGCFQVGLKSAIHFKDFVLANTARGSSKAKAHESGFLFLTSSLDLPPNYDNLISEYKKDKYNYISMWNGKSSVFHFEVVGGNFDVLYLTDSRYSKYDILDSLRIVDSFSPAKTKPQVDFALRNTDYLSSIGNTALSYRINLNNLMPQLDFGTDTEAGAGDTCASGAFAGYENSGLSMRIFGALGGSLFPGFDDSFSTNPLESAHAGLPCFKRAQLNTPFTPTILTTHGHDLLTHTSAIDIPRKSIRRRNFKNTLFQEGSDWYSRRGDSMPIYYNVSSSFPASSFSYDILGFIPSSLNFKTVDDVTNISSVYNVSNSTDSINSYFNVPVSNTYPVRGFDPIWDTSSLNNYITRGEISDIVKVLHALTERMESEKARIEVEENSDFFETSSLWCSVAESLKNQKNYLGSDFSEFFDKRLDQRNVENTLSKIRSTGLHSLYRDYISHYYSKGLGGKLLDSHLDGGTSLLSHVYGPIFYNGNLRVDGSALATSSLLQASSFESQFDLNISKDYVTSNLASVGVSIYEEPIDLYVQDPEYRTPHIVSGVELIDTSASILINPENKFSTLLVDPLLSRPSGDRYFVDNKIILSKSVSHGLPRIKLSLSSTNVDGVLIPDHAFELTLKCIPFLDTIPEIGGANVGVWIHTDAENDVDGNKVFWNYMPDGNWRMIDSSSVTKSSGRNTVLQELAHNIRIKSQEISPDSTQTTYCSESIPTESTFNVPTLNLLGEEELQTIKINFDTINQKIATPLRYFSVNANDTSSGQQVHRPNQKYFVEVFIYPWGAQKDKTFLFDSLSVADKTQKHRARIVEDFTVPEFSKKDEPLDLGVSASFWRENAVRIKHAASSFTGEQTHVPGVLNYSYPDFDYNIPVEDYMSSDNQEFWKEYKGDWFEHPEPWANPLDCAWCNNGDRWGHYLRYPWNFYFDAPGQNWSWLQVLHKRYFEGWSTPLEYPSYAAGGAPNGNSGLKRIVDTATSRPIDFPEGAADTLFPVMSLENTDYRSTTPDNPVPWLTGEYYAGEQHFSISESQALSEHVALWHVNDLFTPTDKYLIEMRTSLQDQYPWRDAIYDPTGTYFGIETRRKFDNDPHAFADWGRNATLDFLSGGVPPNGIWQDIKYDELVDGQDYTFSVYLKTGDGNIEVTTDPVTNTNTYSYGGFVVTLSYLRPYHPVSWFGYSPSGAVGTTPNAGNDGNTAHWDAAKSLPYATFRYTPGTDASSMQVWNTAIPEENCWKFEKLSNGWFRVGVSLKWRSNWMIHSDEYDSATNQAPWDNKEKFGTEKPWEVHGLRVSIQAVKPYGYQHDTIGNSVAFTSAWKAWGTLFHEGDSSDIYDFSYLDNDLFAGDRPIVREPKELCYLDSSGNVFTGDVSVSAVSDVGSWGRIGRVTTAVRTNYSQDMPLIKLNTQISAVDFAHNDYTGFFYLDDMFKPNDLAGNNFTSITHKSQGSYVKAPKKAYVDLEKEELLVLLRYFNKLTNNLGSRNSFVTSGIMDASGGGRLNYRYHPYQKLGDGNISTQAANYLQITDIDFTN